MRRKLGTYVEYVKIKQIVLSIFSIRRIENELLIENVVLEAGVIKRKRCFRGGT